jgi:hypothetical protein
MMNLKKLVSIMLILTAIGTAVVVAQQPSQWNSEGKMCYSYLGVDYYYSNPKTKFWNHNTYPVTVFYITKSGTQSSIWLPAGEKGDVSGEVQVVACQQ